jgi:hypothetical protein
MWIDSLIFGSLGPCATNDLKAGRIMSFARAGERIGLYTRRASSAIEVGSPKAAVGAQETNIARESVLPDAARLVAVKAKLALLVAYGKP